MGSPPFLGVTAGVTQRNASHGSLKDGFKLFQGETRKNAFLKSGIHIKNAVIILHGFLINNLLNMMLKLMQGKWH